MNPDANTLWRGSRSGLALLLALLGMLGPFSIDTYIPAFDAIARSLQATPVQMQQTLSAYLFGFAFMSLFHGALSDSFGRRPVVLCGVALFTFASVGCALSQNVAQLIAFRALQGLSTGAGIVVSRAVIRDLFPPAKAQKMMSLVTLYFGIAPVIAPIVGGWFSVGLGWASVFWFLAAVGAAMWLANFRFLPETLHAGERQPFSASNLFRGYRELASSPRFLLLALASGVPFNGMFLYVMAGPAFLGQHLGLAPTQFFWLFVLIVSGIMAGAWTSGRMAGRIAPKTQVARGFGVMLLVSLVNLAANATLAPHPAWAMLPVALYSFGWALMTPVVTLLVLDLHPNRRGMASSMQSFVGAAANGITAGLIAPLVMGSTMTLALASFGMLAVGLLAWLLLRWRWSALGG